MRSACSKTVRVISQGLRRLSILFFLGFTLTTANAQPITYEIAQNSYFFDFLTFKAFEGNKTFLEIFCKLPFRNLKFVKTFDGFTAYYNLDVTILNQRNVPVQTSSFTDSIKVKSYEEIGHLGSSSEIVRFTFVIKPGDYKAHVTITDNHGLTFKGFRRNLRIPNYTKKGLLASDIQVATSITTTKQKSMLVKNGKEIMPNVPHIYGLDSNVLYIYSELYNLHYKKKKNSNVFLATYTIFNQNGEKIKKIKQKQDKPGKTCAFSVGIPVGELESGHYVLAMDVTDLDNFQTVTRKTHFHIVKDSSYRKIVI